MDLTKSQMQVVIQLLSWFFTTDKQSVTLSGVAGTGKSTIIKKFAELCYQKMKFNTEILSEGFPQDIPYSIHCLSTTFTGLGTFRYMDTPVGVAYFNHFFGIKTDDNFKHIPAQVYHVSLKRLNIVEDAQLTPDVFLDSMYPTLRSGNHRFVWVADRAATQSNTVKMIFDPDFATQIELTEIYGKSEEIIDMVTDMAKHIIEGEPYKVKLNGSTIIGLNSQQYHNTIKRNISPLDTIAICFGTKQRNNLNLAIVEHLGKNKLPENGDYYRLDSIRSEFELNTLVRFENVRPIISGVYKSTFISEYSNIYADVCMPNGETIAMSLSRNATFNEGKAVSKSSAVRYTYPYATTVKLATGSHWDNVFVDFDNILRCPDIGKALQIFYIAASRANKRVIINMGASWQA